MQSYLEDIVPASQRKRVYAIVSLLGLIAAAFQAAMLVANGTAPTWLSVVTTVVLVLTGGTQKVAEANTKPDKPYAPSHLGD